MPMKSIFIRPVAIALALASLTACSNANHESFPASGAADKAAEAANRDALKNFSSGKAPAWENRKFGEKPNSTKAEEGKRHD